MLHLFEWLLLYYRTTPANSRVYLFSLSSLFLSCWINIVAVCVLYWCHRDLAVDDNYVTGLLSDPFTLMHTKYHFIVYDRGTHTYSYVLIPPLLLILGGKVISSKGDFALPPARLLIYVHVHGRSHTRTHTTTHTHTSHNFLLTHLTHSPDRLHKATPPKSVTSSITRRY